MKVIIIERRLGNHVKGVMVLALTEEEYVQYSKQFKKRGFKDLLCAEELFSKAD